MRVKSMMVKSNRSYFAFPQVHLLDICISFVYLGYNESIVRRLMKFLTLHFFSGISPPGSVIL